jgi:uncharacterized protein YjbI with pentapeptide repeats
VGSERDANTGGGNYSENIGGHYIQANQVVINPPAATTITDTLAPIHENNGCAKRLAFAIAGTVDQADEAKLQAILQLLRKLAGDDSIEIVDIQKGSIKLILSGSPEGLEKLKALFEAGELTEVLDIPVETVQFAKPAVIGTPREPAQIPYVNNPNALLFGGEAWNNEEPSPDTLKIETVMFVEPENSDSKDVQENISKSCLIEAIKTERIGQDLRGRDLSGADLSGADLSGADLSGADLSDAILTDAILNGTILIDAILTRAILCGALLCGADLNGAILIDANLTRAILSGAILSHSIRNGGKLTGANLSSVNLSGADLSSSVLTRANLSGANLSSANLSGANLSGANLSGANLTRAFLNDADVTAANFKVCQGISDAEKEGLKRRGAIFDDDRGDRSSTYELIPR